MKKQLLILLVFLLGVVSFANVTKYDIKKIEIVNNRETPYEVVESVMKSKVGSKYVTENMIHDFKAIKNLKSIDDVAIYPKPYDNGIDLIVDVTENPNAQKILEDEHIIPLSKRYQVDTNLIVSQVDIFGASQIPLVDINKMIGIKVGEYFSRAKVIAGQRKLLESGYFQNVVPDAYDTPNGVKVIYDVLENPIVKGINIIGNTVFTTQQLMSVIQTKPGEVFNVNTIRADRDRIMKAYQDAGYVLANVNDIQFSRQLDLDIYISEGVIRHIELKKMVKKQKGNRRQATDDRLKTRKYVIERELDIKPGQIFNSRNYDETVENLMRLGLFKNVKYEVQDVPGDPDGKNIVLLLDEARTAQLQGAISYGTEVGLMGQLSIKDTNWQGKGQEIGMSVEKSNKDYTSYSINFFDPWIKNTDRVSWGWGIYKSNSEDGDSAIFRRQDTLGARMNVGKGIARFTRLSIGTKLEKIREKSDMSYFGDLPDGKHYWKPPYWEPAGQAPNQKNLSQNIVKGLNDKYYIWSLYPSITYDSRNNYWNPTKGIFARLQVESGYATGYKASMFTNVTTDLRTYHRGLFKSNTFAYRLIGGIQSDSTKEGQRYWAGGGNSLRGYDGGYFKGTKKLIGTIENRTQINDILGVVLFADAGRAWSYDGRDRTYQHNNRFPKQIATTAGFGLRLNTPMGPLRFDFGWPVGNKIGKTDGMQFYFNMGQSF